MTKFKTILGVVLIFILGGISGSLVMYLLSMTWMDSYTGRKPEVGREELIVQRLNRKLSLDDVQLEQVRAIMKEVHSDIKAVRKQFQPQLESILERGQEKIRSVLRPDQMEKYEKIISERKERRKKREP